MTFEEYCRYFKAIIEKGDEKQIAPYDNPVYIDYTRLNWSRMSRWLKKGQLTDELVKTIKSIQVPQHWIVITEPWCGDAAHSVPFIHLAGLENPLITVSCELRDSEPFRINAYLTNHTKSIPKLIVKDAHGNDIATWGPRPVTCQVLYKALMDEKADFEKIKTELQLWYNADKGQSVQQELAALFR